MVRQIVPALLAWFSRNARELPWRNTLDPYAVWVSEIMLQQTQVRTVIPYWERWMRELPTVSTLAGAAPQKVLKLWEGLGYYTRVRNMQKAAQVIGQIHAGQFPKSFEEVLDLPGIGRYTAGAICSIAFNEPKPILDGNVVRVLTRVFNIAEDPREKITNARLWQLAESLVAEASALESQSLKLNAQNFPHASHLNQSLMELGALICTPRQPKCLLCPVQTRCLSRAQGTAEKLPNLGERLRPRRAVSSLSSSNIADASWCDSGPPAWSTRTFGNSSTWKFPRRLEI